MECASEAAEIQKSLGSAGEGNTHAIKQINDGRSGLAHRFYRRLIREKVTAVNRVVKVLPGRVAFAFKIFGRVDAALRANRVRALDRHNGKQIHVSAISAILMTAESPASPPPTTIIFGFVILKNLKI